MLTDVVCLKKKKKNEKEKEKEKKIVVSVRKGKKLTQSKSSIERK